MADIDDSTPTNDPVEDMRQFEAQFAATATTTEAEREVVGEAGDEDEPDAEVTDVIGAGDIDAGGDDASDTDASGDDASGGDDVAATADGTLLEDAEVLDIEELPEPEPSPYDRPGRWYVVHTYAGYENKVKSNLASRVRSMNVEDRIYEVVIPMEDVIEFKNGRKVVVQKKVFPGYLLVRMGLDDDAWYVVRNTPGVTGFVGSGARPTHLSKREVEDILGTGEKVEGPAAEKKVRPRLEYEVSEQVRVVTGPFADFNGVISEIDVDRSKLKVLVNIFGRETPVELEFADVAKL